MRKLESGAGEIHEVGQETILATPHSIFKYDFNDEVQPRCNNSITAAFGSVTIIWHMLPRLDLRLMQELKPVCGRKGAASADRDAGANDDNLETSLGCGHGTMTRYDEGCIESKK